LAKVPEAGVCPAGALGAGALRERGEGLKQLGYDVSEFIGLHRAEVGICQLSLAIQHEREW
jgi:hypothetical protein